MSLTRKVSKCGNSKAIVLPTAVLEQLGWNIGDEVELVVEGEKLIIQLEPPPRFQLFGKDKRDG